MPGGRPRLNARRHCVDDFEIDIVVEACRQGVCLHDEPGVTVHFILLYRKAQFKAEVEDNPRERVVILSDNAAIPGRSAPSP